MGKVQNPVICNGGGKKNNVNFRFEIDVTPNENTATWAELKVGVHSLESSLNEVLDQTTTLDGEGWGQTIVTGGQLIWAFSAERAYGDLAQDFIFGRAWEFGCARVTNFRAIAPNGDVAEGNVTIANITGPGGDAGGKGIVSFEIHFNGKPDVIPYVH